MLRRASAALRPSPIANHNNNNNNMDNNSNEDVDDFESQQSDNSDDDNTNIINNNDADDDDGSYSSLPLPFGPPRGQVPLALDALLATPTLAHGAQH
mmetsp:Transcript_22013/g.48100  ORF Transcript_22013/g.48100 Transcript_22013/m.48100 type:complete len:97 (-) Transcript_22013:789-1079(-)